MSLQEVKEEAFKLSVSDRLALVNFIIQSLQSELCNQTQESEGYIPASSLKGRLIEQMRGFLKTDKSAPTDTEIKAMLEERLEKYY